MAVVYSREQDGKEIHFGTSGFTMKRVFVLFDRETDSIWYPGKDGALEAVGGARKGDSIPVLVHPEVLRLGDWLKKHPDSKILLSAPRFSKTVHDLKRKGTETGPGRRRGPG